MATRVLINFERLHDGQDPTTSDGVVVVTSVAGRGQYLAVALADPAKVPVHALRKFDSALKSSDFIVRNQNGVRPGFGLGEYTQLAFSAPDEVFEEELDLFLKFLRQSRVMQNPIVSDMTWLQTNRFG